MPFPIGIQIPSEKVVWGVFRRLNTFSEGSWIPRDLTIVYNYEVFLTLRVYRRPHRKISLGVSQGNLSEGRCSLGRKAAELVVK